MSDESRKGKPRVVEPQRRQGVIRFEMPEDKLAPTHTARVLWDVIGALDLTTTVKVKAHVDVGPARARTSEQGSETLCPPRLEPAEPSRRRPARRIGLAGYARRDLGWRIHSASSPWSIASLNASAKLDGSSPPNPWNVTTRVPVESADSRSSTC